MKALSAVLTYARDVLKLPCAKPRIKTFTVKRKKGALQFFSREEVGFILASCLERAPDFWPLVMFLFETGCRKSEVLNLTWKNVQLDAKLVRIWSDAGDDNEPEDEEDAYQVKSVEREIPLSDAALQMLRTQKIAALSHSIVFPVRKNNQDFTKGERYKLFPKHTWAMVLAHANVLAAEAAKGTGVTPRAIKGGPHKCRHTFSSYFLESMPDLFQLGRVLGHTNSKVTELYSHLVPGHLDDLRGVVTFAAAKSAKSK